MFRSELIAKCSAASGALPRDVDAALTALEAAISRKLAERDGPVRIDDFGTFEWFKGGIVFRTSPILLQNVNRAPEPPPVPPPPPPPVGPATAADAESGFTLPVHPISAEDRMLIDRWLHERTSGHASADAAVILITSIEKRMTIGTEKSLITARKAIEPFARRCPVPLAQVGLSNDRGELEMYEHGALLKEVNAYWRDYLTRSRPRLAQYKDSRVAQNLGWKEMALRTQAWKQFVSCGRDFYSWLESAGFRPAETNPFKLLRRVTALDLARGRRILVRRWAREMLRNDRMSPKERAVLYLLANGLRSYEARHAWLQNLNLREGTLRVLGKRNKTRVVELLPEVVPALNAYLQSRRDSTSPWLFPGDSSDKPMAYDTVSDIVSNVCRATFPKPDQANIRASISPHKFRHYFITLAWARGMKPRNIMEETGILNPTTLERYITPEPEDVKRDIRRISKNRFF